MGVGGRTKRKGQVMHKGTGLKNKTLFALCSMRMVRMVQISVTTPLGLEVKHNVVKNLPMVSVLLDLLPFSNFPLIHRSAVV
jgi:hypothetical protein